MSQEDFDATLTEGQNALLSLDSYDLWQFDTEIRDERTITKNTNLEEVEMVGRGGTRFQCVVDKLKTLRKKPKLMVVMTDLEFEWDWHQDDPGPKSFKKDLKEVNEYLNDVLNNPKKTFPKGLYPTLRLVFKS